MNSGISGAVFNNCKPIWSN